MYEFAEEKLKADVHVLNQSENKIGTHPYEQLQSFFNERIGSILYECHKRN